MTDRWALLPLPRHPATAHRENLANETIGRLTAKIGSKFGIFFRSHEAPQGNLSLQALLKARIGLQLRRELHRVVALTAAPSE